MNPNEFPVSARALVHNLRRLDRDSDPLEWVTVEIMYKKLLHELPDPRHREELLKYVIRQVEDAEANAATILGFVRHERHHRMVRLAVRGYLQNRRASFEEPFIATAELVSLLVSGEIANRGAAYESLVFCGDRRVCAVARTIRDTMSDQDAIDFAEAISGPVSPSSVEFCLTWVVDALVAERWELAETVASALEPMLVEAASGPICDCLYAFGPFGFLGTLHLPAVAYGELRGKLLSILHASAAAVHPVLARLLTVIANPAHAASEQLELADQRSERRNTVRDRRVINIVPHIERRKRHRRMQEERRDRRDRRDGKERRLVERRAIQIAPELERRGEQRRNVTERRTQARR